LSVAFAWTLVREEDADFAVQVEAKGAESELEVRTNAGAQSELEVQPNASEESELELQTNMTNIMGPPKLFGVKVSGHGLYNNVFGKKHKCGYCGGKCFTKEDGAAAQATSQMLMDRLPKMRVDLEKWKEAAVKRLQSLIDHDQKTKNEWSDGPSRNTSELDEGIKRNTDYKASFEALQINDGGPNVLVLPDMGGIQMCEKTQVCIPWKAFVVPNENSYPETNKDGYLFAKATEEEFAEYVKYPVLTVKYIKEHYADETGAPLPPASHPLGEPAAEPAPPEPAPLEPAPPQGEPAAEPAPPEPAPPQDNVSEETDSPPPIPRDSPPPPPEDEVPPESSADALGSPQQWTQEELPSSGSEYSPVDPNSASASSAASTGT
jgi:hypothetical protein